MRPQLEYAVHLWSPYQTGLREKLERTQRRATGVLHLYIYIRLTCITTQQRYTKHTAQKPYTHKEDMTTAITQHTQCTNDDLKALQNWTITNGMKFNVDKCSVMHCDRLNRNIDYKLYGGKYVLKSLKKT